MNQLALFLSVGDKVRHKSYEGTLRIKRMWGSVATLEEIDKEKIWNIHGEKVYPIVICKIENLVIKGLKEE